MPPSFQDAITITRAIGLRWLWIDSLCIVQDDEDDWRRESQLMGSIFENSEVTLAASHAKDSWQGFLHQRAERSASVRLPGLTHDTEGNNISVMATLRYESIDDTFPEHGVLNTRAWATQEWLLSRRMVFFTSEALVWSCKEITQRETGERCYNVSRNLSWIVIVERYSDRQLTFKTDRLMALEGLRRKMAEKTGFTYALGLWTQGLPHQLLWQVTEQQPHSNVLGAPSWTWLSVPCGVRFLLVHKAKSLITNVVFEEPLSRLSLRGWVKAALAVDVALEDINSPVVECIREDLKESNVRASATMARLLRTHDDQPLGWIVFDTTENDEPVREVALMSLMGSILRRDEETERRTGRIVSKKMRHYWVLALRRLEDGTYSRVGVGKTYGREWWENAFLGTVTLV
ncbi:heterokaryon incompatibility protein (HET) domain-containing protein [Sarocladium implicatum]|nr:heterokaryon incompatibility protein (HET) domain-containing protein [Sarocladium implicatum]